MYQTELGPKVVANHLAGPTRRNWAKVGGMSMTDEAKMTGMTPAMFTLRGMYVLAPPSMRRPTTRFAYCTGTRRSPVVIQMTATTTAMAMIAMAIWTPMLSVNILIKPSGSREMMLMKIRIDIPLPMPRAVMSSPNHITAAAVSYTHLTLPTI